MASGDRIMHWLASDGIPPSANFAALVRRNNHLVAAFDAATDEALDFEGVFPITWPATDITVKLIWASQDQTTNSVVWDVSFERIGAAQQDLDADGFAAVRSVTTATNATAAGNTVESTITFTQAQADSIARGEMFRRL